MESPLTEISQLPPAQAPVWGQTKTVLKVYEPDVVKTHVQAIVVPPTGGENFLDRHLATGLCRRGISTRILTYQSALPVDTLDLRVHDLGTEEFLAQLEMTLRAYPQPTNLIGSSLGGLLSSIAYGMASQNGFTNHYRLAFEPKRTIELLKGATLTVSGGSVSQVLADSKVGAVVQQRQRRMSTSGFSRDEYELALRQNIKLDTLATANPKMSKNVLFFEGLYDRLVPTPYQEALWRAWGQPTRETYSAGHPETIFMVYYLRIGKIADFVLSL